MTNKIVSTCPHRLDGLVLTNGDAVFRVFAPKWWHVHAWAWWLFQRGKGWVVLTTQRGRVRARVVRIARRHVRIGGAS